MDQSENIRNDMQNNLTTLLTEHSQGIRLNDLEEMYKTKFSRSLMSELIKIALPNITNRIAFITTQHQENCSVDGIITLKPQEEGNDREQDQLLQEITASGIVSADFSYEPNPLISHKDETFLAYVSNIDKRHLFIYMQPECYMKYMERLTQLLDFYYSNPISDNLLVKEVATGLACVSKFEGIYHRTLVKANNITTYVVAYVDLGIAEEVNKSEVQFKHLLVWFSTSPCMAIACRLADIEWKLTNYQMSPETYKELSDLCQGGPFFVEPDGEINGVLNVRISDFDQQYLNEVVVVKGLAFSSSAQLDMTASRITATKNGDDQQKTQHNVNPACLMDDYEEDPYVPQNPTITSSSRTNTHRGHVVKNTASTSNGEGLKPNIQASNSTNKFGTSSDRRNMLYSSVLSAEPTNKQSSTSKSQRNDRNVRNNENQPPFTITIGQNISGAARLFGSAWSSLAHNNSRTQRQTSHSAVSTNRPKEDAFVNWMCSWSIEQSLWLSDEYRNALLKYIGRIYKQETHMYRLFHQLKNDMQNLDELDLLNKLIEKTKERLNAQVSFDKWKDNSRIDRRVKDIKLIFEFDGHSTPSNHPFVVAPNGLKEIIGQRAIKSYFDYGCGDGVITASIGHYLGLTKESIFGGDVFVGQSKDITFVKVNENQSSIEISTKSVDLVTAFVTFHHISQVTDTLKELARILRPGGYLILREHDCKSDYAFTAKYLNFVHAIMMIAGVGEFENSSKNSKSINQNAMDDYQNDSNNWSEQKSHILKYVKSIHYRTCEEWRQQLDNVGFRFRATLHYGADGGSNPQKLFYGVYQLDTK